MVKEQKKMSKKQIKQDIIDTYEYVYSRLAEIRSRLSFLTLESSEIDTDTLNITQKIYDFTDSVESLNNAIDQLKKEVK
jgi:uncharacterized protein YfcZ (UPF0381/DUF406 family)